MAIIKITEDIIESTLGTYPRIPGLGIVGSLTAARRAGLLNVQAPKQPVAPRIDQLPKGQLLFFSLAFAQAHGVTEAIVHYYLQTKAAEGGTVLNNGHQWIAFHSLGEMLHYLPCFEHRSILQAALGRLRAKKLIGIGNSDELMGYGSDNYSFKTGFAVERANAENCYALRDAQLPTDLVYFDANEAKQHGMLKAMLMSAFRRQPDHLIDGVVYKRLSAVNLEKELPYKDRAIRDTLKEMIAGGWLVQHPKRKKYYRLP